MAVCLNRLEELPAQLSHGIDDDQFAGALAARLGPLPGAVTVAHIPAAGPAEGFRADPCP
jgi:hypothetical protein